MSNEIHRIKRNGKLEYRCYNNIYLVAVIDFFSRYVLSWEISNTLDGHFCLEALEKALM